MEDIVGLFPSFRNLEIVAGGTPVSIDRFFISIECCASK